ncbi:MAG: GtrA family protein [Oscillospiraceae bacterium]|nr:GtrA family protein [Oscillospiraceae bacterium]
MRFIKSFFANDRLREMFRFVVTGGFSFLVDFGLMVFLVEIFHMNELFAAGISFTVSVIVNYLMCVFWVFDATQKNNVLTIIIFIVSSIIGLGLNELFMWILLEIYINYMVAKIISTILVMIWNYIAKRKAITLQNKK